MLGHARHFSRPRCIGTASSSTQLAKMRSVCFLNQCEPVRVSSGKVADVQTNSREPRDLRHPPLRKEPLGYSALIENLDGARVQAECT